MSDQEVRAGIQQAKNGEIGLNVIGIEALIVGGIAGGMGHSWTLGLVGFFLVAVLAHLAAKHEKAANVIAAIMGIVWAVLAFIALETAKASDGATTIIPPLALAFGFSFHYWGFQMLRDLQRAKG